MADQAAAGWAVKQYHPGNPELPALPSPSDPSIGKRDEFGNIADLVFAIQGEEILPTFAAQGADGFAGWYLDTVWLTPGLADFGDVTAEKDITVTLHNTFRTSQDLTAVDLTALPGLSQPSPGLPLTIEPFSSQSIILRAAAAGPDSFDDFAVLTFSVSGNVSYRCRGQRVLFFHSLPENVITEQVIFVSDLMRSKDGSEQAFSDRLAPSAKVRFPIKYKSDEERSRAEAILFGGSPQLKIGYQLWWEAQTTTAQVASSSAVILIDTTEGSWFVADNVSMVLPDRTHVEGEIDSITPTQLTLTQPVGVTLPIGTDVMPVRFGYMSRGARLGIRPVKLVELIIEFTSHDERDFGFLDLSFFDQYAEDNLAIIRKRFILGRSARATISREQDILESVTGLAAVRGSEPLGEYGTAVVFPLESKAEIWAFRQFLHYLRGSWRQFYMPTFQNDLPLSTALIRGGNTFVIPSMGIETHLNGVVPKRDVRILDDQGTIFYRRITGVVDNGTTETVTVNGVIGSSGSSPVAETTISWMHLSRIAGDVATFTHRTAGIADLKLNVRSTKA